MDKELAISKVSQFEFLLVLELDSSWALWLGYLLACRLCVSSVEGFGVGDFEGIPVGVLVGSGFGGFVGS